MPIMNFDLQDGMPPVSFSINGEGAERMMNFMSECQQDRDAHAMQSDEIAELRAKVESLAADAELEKHAYGFTTSEIMDGTRRHGYNMTNSEVLAAMAKEKA